MSDPCATIPGMTGNTPRRAIRVDDDTWQAASERATEEGRTVSDIVRIALRAYAEDQYDALPPVRRRSRT